MLIGESYSFYKLLKPQVFRLFLVPFRLEGVSQLIAGFETPYGMEMLATIHWVATEEPQAAVDCERAIELVQEWSERKRKLFKPAHLRKAWKRLHEQNWLSVADTQAAMS